MTILCACSWWVPWEKFRRATSIPAAMSLRIMRGERVAGPMVQTILECREFIRPPIVCDVSPILKTELKKQILRAKYTQDDHWRAAGLKTERTAAIEAYRLTENPATMRVMR